MTKAQRFIWEVYFLVILLFSVRTTFNFFDTSSDIYLYFQILRAFDPLFEIVYLFNLFQIIFNLLNLFPLALFIYKRQIFPVFVWRILFILKVIFDLVGHSYEINMFKSLWHHDPMISLTVFLSSIAIYIPAYVVLFVYAFQQKKLDLESF